MSSCRPPARRFVDRRANPAGAREAAERREGRRDLQDFSRSLGDRGPHFPEVPAPLPEMAFAFLQLGRHRLQALSERLQLLVDRAHELIDAPFGGDMDRELHVPGRHQIKLPK